MWPTTFSNQLDTSQAASGASNCNHKHTAGTIASRDGNVPHLSGRYRGSWRRYNAYSVFPFKVG